MPAEARAIPDSDPLGPVQQYPEGTTPALHQEFDVDELQPICLGDRKRESPNFFSHIQFRHPRAEMKNGVVAPAPLLAAHTTKEMGSAASRFPEPPVRGSGRPGPGRAR